MTSPRRGSCCPTKSTTWSVAGRASSDGSTGRKIAALEVDHPVTAAEVDRLANWSKQTVIKMDFEETEAARSAYATLVRAFSGLSASSKKWDLTSDRDTDTFRERTIANRVIELAPDPP